MIAWINFAFLIFSSLFLLYFYIKSVSPAALEKVYGPGAYARCGRYRVVAMVFEFITVINYVVYYFYPLPIPFPEAFPWSRWISIVIAAAILLPSGYLMVKGMIDAGAEAVAPKKEHKMYGGIYEKIRHPQAAGEVFLWWVVAFFLHSPFLVIVSFIYVPIFMMMCEAEEHDLVLRFGESYVDYHRRTGAYFPRRQRS